MPISFGLRCLILFCVSAFAVNVKDSLTQLAATCEEAGESDAPENGDRSLLHQRHWLSSGFGSEKNSEAAHVDGSVASFNGDKLSDAQEPGEFVAGEPPAGEEANGTTVTPLGTLDTTMPATATTEAPDPANPAPDTEGTGTSDMPPEVPATTESATPTEAPATAAPDTEGAGATATPTEAPATLAPAPADGETPATTDIPDPTVPAPDTEGAGATATPTEAPATLAPAPAPADGDSPASTDILDSAGNGSAAANSSEAPESVAMSPPNTTTTETTTETTTTETTTTVTTTTLGHTVPLCGTRTDPTKSSLYYTQAPEGTPCMFGVDVRDEGSHCIMDDTSYGYFGWCWTNVQMDTWGTCNATCPLFGPLQVLGKKIDDLRRDLLRSAQTQAGANKTMEPTVPAAVPALTQLLRSASGGTAEAGQHHLA